MKPICLTNLKSNHQLLYFTSPSITGNGRILVCIGDGTGHPNLFAKHLDTGEFRQLTHNTEGYLKSYVYFDGRANEGFGKASVSLHVDSGTIFYIQGRDICKVDLNGQIQVLNQLPKDQVTAFTHVSADGTRLCVPTTDARALEYDHLTNRGRPSYNIDQRVRDERLNSYLRVYNVDSGELEAVERVPGAWITHVQFSPQDRNLILYNHEWPSDCGIRRIWLWDGKQHRALRTENEQRSRADWTCHEMWTQDGQSVIYHGSYPDNICYIGKYDLATQCIKEIRLPEQYRKYGHFTVGTVNNNWLVSDGYYFPSGELPEQEYHDGAWLSMLQVDWEHGEIQWIPLCRHGSNWDSQDSHPHPIFAPGDQKVYFTSNKEGNRAVYSVDISGI